MGGGGGHLAPFLLISDNAKGGCATENIHNKISLHLVRFNTSIIELGEHIIYYIVDYLSSTELEQVTVARSMSQ